MTDNAPSWLTDPTGRHDHRYWDGSQWTEHVSDAGVATTDPYDGPASVAAPSPEAPATGEPVVGSPSTEPTPEPGASELDATAPPTPSPAPAAESEATPTAPTATTAPTMPSYATPGPPAADDPNSPAAADGSNAADADEPTVVQPISADPTSEVPTTSVAADDPPSPTFTPPPPAVEGSDGNDGSKRRLLIGVGVLAVVAVLIAVFALGGDDSEEDLAAVIADQIRDGGQSGLDEDEATCLAEELISEMGADKLDGVDFTAEEPPEELAEELNQAFVQAIPECDIDLSGEGNEGGETTGTVDDGRVDGGTEMTIEPGTSDEFRDRLTNQFSDSMGVTDDQAACLANSMADAIEAGELDEEESFNQFFEYLDGCNISVSDLDTGAGAAP